jgi:G3E family GTPase
VWKGLLSVVAGNTPGIRGVGVDRLLRLSPRAVVLAVSIQSQEAGYPVVQRFLSGVDAGVPATCWAATGDPVVILRQDLMSLRRDAGPVHVVLALPGDVDVLPFLVELWRARVASGSLGEHFEPAPVVVGVEPSPFMADVGCVHRAVRLWSGGERGEVLSPAESAVRQVEAADVLLVPAPAGGDGEQAPLAARLVTQLNSRARLVTPADMDGAGPELRASLVRAVPSAAEGEWRARLEPVTVPAKGHCADRGVETVLWGARRPLHPGRLRTRCPSRCAVLSAAEATCGCAAVRTPW